ncbi:MAG: hypothetical protein ABL903_18065 [Methylococcales bacterium]
MGNLYTLKNQKCSSCKFCMPCPKSNNYKGFYGWCHSPLPFWIENRLPLIAKKDFIKKSCSMYSKGIYDLDQFNEGPKN